MGARDRKELKDTVYDVVRHKGMLKKLARGDAGYDQMIDLLRSSDFENQRKNPSFEE